MRCPACDAQIEEDDRVCDHCGVKLDQGDSKKTMMGSPAMGGDQEEPEDDSENDSRSTLFGIPAANKDKDSSPSASGAPGPVQDDNTPVPDAHMQDDDATQVADEELMTGALAGNNEGEEKPRSTMFGIPSPSSEVESDEDEVASAWSLGEESSEEDSGGETMVASANILDRATTSDVEGEGTGYSRPQVEGQPNMQTLMGMSGPRRKTMPRKRTSKRTTLQRRRYHLKSSTASSSRFGRTRTEATVIVARISLKSSSAGRRRPRVTIRVKPRLASPQLKKAILRVARTPSTSEEARRGRSSRYRHRTGNHRTRSLKTRNRADASEVKPREAV